MTGEYANLNSEKSSLQVHREKLSLSCLLICAHNTILGLFIPTPFLSRLAKFFELKEVAEVKGLETEIFRGRSCCQCTFFVSQESG